jgi:hypothetical protein
VVGGSYLESTLTHLYDNILVPSDICHRQDQCDYISLTFLGFIKYSSDVLLSPISASIIAIATRISPNTTKEEYDDILLRSTSKEISASINIASLAKLDFRCIFSSELHAREIPFSSRMAMNPEVASDTYQVFCRLRQSLHRRLVFPSTGLKTVGARVAQSFWEEYYRSGETFMHDGRFTERPVTPRDCLKLYEKTGGYVAGPVELRQTWKYAQIQPRVYFARGGDVLPTSQYVQPIVNEIIDAFPETHRRNRFSPPEDPLDDTDVEIIYDYTSFTSTIESVVEFIRSMSIFFKGTQVVLIDVRNGPILTDLGDLFMRYNDECNEYASFDTGRALSSWVSDGPVLQHTCGMLGVEGNIFLATLLHGLHLRFAVGLRKSKCVGDDARCHEPTAYGTLRPNDLKEVHYVLSGIGELNEEKMGKFERNVDPDLQAFRYVKRPFRRDLDIMVEGLMFDLPSPVELLGMRDDFHDLHSSTHPCRSAFRSIVRLLRVLKLHSITLETDEEGVSMIAKYIKVLTEAMRKTDPDGTYSPFMRSSIRTNYRLPSVKDWGKITYEDWVLDDLGYSEKVRFLKRGGGDPDFCDGRLGSEMIKEVSKARGFLEKMGYLSRENLFDEVSLEEIGYHEMREYLLGTYRSVCKFTVIETIPPWYSMIPGAL